MKLAVVGAGSTYTPEVIDGIVRLRDVLAVDDLAMHDTNEERLASRRRAWSTSPFRSRATASPEDDRPGLLGLSEEQIWLPDRRDPAGYDERIAEAGGIDLFLLASGASDGHVAFVPPGSSRSSRTAVVEIARTTRRDNLATFPEFASLDDVPTHGVTVGLGTIAAARALRLVLQGEGKREAAARLLEVDRFDEAWPASIVHEHDDAEIWVDRAALG